MVIIEDTRNKIGKHRNINAWLEKHGYTVVRRCLNVGDYQIEGDERISIDTKMDVMQLIGNVYRDHARFRRECIRANERGTQLIVLVEEQLPGGKLENWQSPVYHIDTAKHRRGEPMTKADPKALRKALITMQRKYGVKFRFCHPSETGQLIVDYLEGRRS